MVNDKEIEGGMGKSNGKEIKYLLPLTQIIINTVTTITTTMATHMSSCLSVGLSIMAYRIHSKLTSHVRVVLQKQKQQQN